MAIQQYLGTGRRKTSIARIFLSEGNGDVVVRTRGKEVKIKEYLI